MPKQRKNGILVFLVLLTSIGVLSLAIATVMLMGSPLSSPTKAVTRLRNPPGRTTMAMTPQELLVSSDMQQRFSVLSKASTDYCANIGIRPAIDANMAHMAQDSYLQGSCCSLMDRTQYERQILALKAYAHISQIPTDPYNVPVSLAKTLLQYDQSIQLTPAQQATYNQAATMTNDKGWCCCQCWAWYVHSGLAKYLIATQHFSAVQVATVINEEDCCGGA
jgi:hypothetical protein